MACALGSLGSMAAEAARGRDNAARSNVTAASAKREKQAFMREASGNERARGGDDRKLKRTVCKVPGRVKESFCVARIERMQTAGCCKNSGFESRLSAPWGGGATHRACRLGILAIAGLRRSRTR